MNKLLIIDDDCKLFRLLDEYLGNSGFLCFHAPDGEAGLAALAGESWDLAIVDVMLPGKSGHEVLRRIRSGIAASDLPVLMLTARGGEDDKVTGLEAGADDYLAKPFGVKELVARLHALLRRTNRLPAAEGGDPPRLDDLAIDRKALLVWRGETRVEITASELRLLELFAGAPGRVIERGTLYRKILGHPPFGQDRSLDMMISRLRKKLGPGRDGRERIRSARGQGYVFLQAKEA
ncbi:MAG: response regulator transcription factor [Planctomycetota bacterium]|jgi:DNA-binding response OmpR family regulator|nr:response regulator transcription factor [Planctomycetota bacterium]